MPRDKMGTLEDGTFCQNGKIWPPKEVFGYGPDPEAVRPHVSEHRYEHVKTWKRVCGLMKMSQDKCPSCKFALPEGHGPKLERAVDTVQPPTNMLSRGRFGKRR